MIVFSVCGSNCLDAPEWSRAGDFGPLSIFSASQVQGFSNRVSYVPLASDKEILRNAVLGLISFVYILHHQKSVRKNTHKKHFLSKWVFTKQTS